MVKYKCELALLIDNNATDNYAHKLAIIESQLAREVKVVTSGKDAIDYLRHENNPVPQIILFDVLIPIVEGQVFLHEFASLSHPHKNEMKIVILTYHEHDTHVEKLLVNQEITCVESKPLTMDSFDRLGAIMC
ncbi:response regulator [Reichenbachiella ulvae]|uniref:Response regulator n=1 Tax=Reichenbachiella ulvae TaxID=2980104 RepID=A0ABT3CRF1_9BACT|nr:response regulator [Reichenbachiella ulvae]MCV9386270.1 response regulator [Reichenbachiella ulvae]